jgi:hypothetical protein
VVNGRYYADYDPKNTIAHYSAFRSVNVAGLRKQYAEAAALRPEDILHTSPLAPGAGTLPLPRFVAVEAASGDAGQVVGSLTASGYWLAPLGYNSHPFTRQSTAGRASGNFALTHVGDETDTSPYPDDALRGISTAAYIRNMSVLIRALER